MSKQRYPSQINTKLPHALSIVCALFITTQAEANTDTLTEQAIVEKIKKDYPGANIQEVERAGLDWTVDFTSDGTGFEARFTSTGDLVAIESEDYSAGTLFLGLYAMTESAFYRESSSETEVYPLVWYDSGLFYIRGRSLGYRLIQTDFTLATQVNLEFGEGYEPDENDFLSDMTERDMPISVGLLAEKAIGSLELELGAFVDVAGADEGGRVDLGISREFDLRNDWSLEVGIEANWRDQNFNDYFYGVTPEFSTLERPNYVADSGVDVGFELQVRGRLSGNWYLLAQFEYTKFSASVTDSPLVDNSNEVSLGVGIGYAY